MTRDQAKKRFTKIEGTPRASFLLPRAESRRGNPKVSNLTEYEASQFTDLFEFEEDLFEMEAARKQVERLEEEKIQYNQRMKSLGVEPDTEESFFTLTEE